MNLGGTLQPGGSLKIPLDTHLRSGVLAPIRWFGALCLASGNCFSALERSAVLRVHYLQGLVARTRHVSCGSEDGRISGFPLCRLPDTFTETLAGCPGVKEHSRWLDWIASQRSGTGLTEEKV